MKHEQGKVIGVGVHIIYKTYYTGQCRIWRDISRSVGIVMSQRRVEIQSTSEMSPYFTMTNCNKLFITYLTRSSERLQTLPSSISISTISMTVVMTTLFNTRARCSVNFNPLNMGWYLTLRVIVINIYIREWYRTLYVGLQHAIPPTNTKFKPLFLLTQAGMPYAQTFRSTEHHILSLYSHFLVQLSADSPFLPPDKNRKFLRFFL